MIIFATHFAIVLGAWRLRVRIDLDEPRDADERDEREAAPRACATASNPASCGRTSDLGVSTPGPERSWWPPGRR